MLEKRIKNNTAQEEYWVGQGILPGEYYTIDPDEEDKFRHNGKLVKAIEDGYAIMNDGTNDFADTNDAVAFLNTPLITIKSKGNTLTQVAVFDFEDYTSTSTSEPAVLTVGTNSTASVSGAIYPLVFVKNNSSGNKWLSLSENSILSSQVPQGALWSSRLVGIWYSNEEDESEADIEIHKSAAGSGKDTTLVEQWEVRGARVARKTHFASNVDFAPGDKIAVYAKKASSSKQPKDLAVVLYLQILADDSSDSVEDYSGNF